MIVKFSTAVNDTFLIDAAQLTWKRISALLDSNNEPNVLEQGGLVPQGRGVYILDGVKVKDDKDKEQLTTVSITPIPDGNALNIYVQANVPIKDIDLPVGIEIVRAVIVPGRSVADQPAKHVHVQDPQVASNSTIDGFEPLGERLASEGATFEEDTEDAQTPA